MSGLLTADQIAAYRRDGVLHVSGVLDPDEVAVAATAIEKVLAAPSLLSVVASGVDDPGRFVEDFRRWQDIPEIEGPGQRFRLPHFAAELLGGHEIRSSTTTCWSRTAAPGNAPPGTRTSRTTTSTDTGVSAWIPVDPVPLGGCLELAAGTHDGPWLMPRTFLDGKAKWFEEGSLDELPDIDADRSAFDLRQYEMARATPSSSISSPCTARRAFRSRVGVGCCRCGIWLTTPGMLPGTGAPRRRSTSWTTMLPAGAPMDHPLFPLVWP